MSTMNDNLPHVTANTTVNIAVELWEQYLHDQDRSPYTVKAFTGDINILASYLPPDKPVGAITTADLNQFLDWLQKGRGKPCSPKTLSRRITSIKAFFRWLQSYGVIIADPAQKVLQKSVISPLPTVLTTQEEALVIQAANSYRLDEKPDARPYALVTFLLSTVIKKGECLEVNLNHLDLEIPTEPAVFIRYANPDYRHKERRIALPADWLEAYQEYLTQYQPVDALFPWSPRRLEYILEDIGERAGIDKHLSFDMCRWTCALRDLQSGMDPEQIRIKLGVSKIQFREIKMKLTRLNAQEHSIKPHVSNENG